LAPDYDLLGQLRYILYLETEATLSCDERLDALLRRNPQYDYCRKLNQLGPACVCHLKSGGYEIFVAEAMRAGKKLGEIKPSVLSHRTGWSKQFKRRHSELVAAPGR